MISVHVESTLLFCAYYEYKNLYFLSLNSRPYMGLFSAGELNVI